MFIENSVVRLIRDVGELRSGSEGTVMVAFAAEPQEYLVEFVDDQGATLALLVVGHDDLELSYSPPATDSPGGVLD